MNLNAENYLDGIIGSNTPETDGLYPTRKDHAPPQVFYPWRRYLARMLDLFLYNILWSIFLAAVFQVPLIARSHLGSLFDTVIVLIIMLLMEPLFLRLFGTTPGKAVFGLKIESPAGRRLSYQEGLERTWGVFGIGMGYSIPIYNLVRHWKSYELCRDHEPQPWDTHISYTIRDTKWFRGVIFVFVNVIAATLLVAVMYAQQLPPNRGDLTVAEFVENYNYYAKYFGVDLGNRHLDEAGKWVEGEFNGIVYLYADLPEYRYTIENGYVTGISFQVEQKNEQTWPGLYNEQMILLSLSMVGAQHEMSLFSSIPKEIIQQIHYFNGFDITEANIKITCNTKHSGYLITQLDDLIPVDSTADTYLRIDFSINKLT